MVNHSWLIIVKSGCRQFVVHEVPYGGEHQFWEDTDDTESDAWVKKKVGSCSWPKHLRL